VAQKILERYGEERTNEEPENIARGGRKRWSSFLPEFGLW